MTNKHTPDNSTSDLPKTSTVEQSTSDASDFAVRESTSTANDTVEGLTVRVTELEGEVAELRERLSTRDDFFRDDPSDVDDKDALPIDDDDSPTFEDRLTLLEDNVFGLNVRPGVFERRASESDNR